MQEEIQELFLGQVMSKPSVFPAALPNSTPTCTEQIISNLNKPRNEQGLFSLNESSSHKRVWEAWEVQQKRV